MRKQPLCDIVMEGGITSGVVYPAAAARLSREFRLKNIGGTSAGAIAAAATAAAELGRAFDVKDSFAQLEQVPLDLAQPSRKHPEHTRLAALFQPSAGTRPLFELLIASLNAGDALLGAILSGAFRAFYAWFAAGFALPLALAFVLGADLLSWIFALLMALVTGFAAVLFGVYRALAGPFVANGFGLASGYFEDADALPIGHEDEPLTLWLSRLVNRLAGKAPDGPPLTFGELWSGDGSARFAPPEWLRAVSLTDWKYIDLQMITTNLTHSRPYRFPLDDEEQVLCFDPDELKAYFPSAVIEQLCAHAPDYADIAARDRSLPGDLPASLRVLPPAKHVPVVFAARLSLSFPALVSAVPLWAVDFANPQRASRVWKRCWFSDGGLSSNFPIQLFDAPLPLWPTFGFKLENELLPYRPIEPLRADRRGDPVSDSSSESNRFFLPQHNLVGRGDSWDRFDDRAGGAARLGGFVMALLGAARNWPDRVLTRAPGVRDRVVRIYLKKDEGGLNLNMPKTLVLKLAELGAEAAQRLIDRFVPGAAAGSGMGFENHRWVRLRNLAAVLQHDCDRLHSVITASGPGVPPYPELIATHTIAPSRGDMYDVDAAQAAKLQALLERVQAVSLTAAQEPSLTDGPPRRPTVRIMPSL